MTSGVHIDIGGPLRVSDIEMSRGHKASFERRGEIYSFETMEAWQLYGLTAPGYERFMRAALTLSRAGKRLKDCINEPNPLEFIWNLSNNYISLSEAEKIKDMARESEDAYNAAPSRRLNTGARRGVELLYRNDVPMTIVTESYAAPTRDWLKLPEVDLARYFPDDMVFGKDSAGQGSKNPKVSLLLASAEKMSVPINNTVYIADTLGDAQAAKEAGCSVFLVRNGMGIPEVWRRICRPDMEVAHMEEAAHYLCDV